ncbi:hypothetical protein GDO81_003973 [Engystomops pustulosus]|uniref:Uncharacterized protein n=1 Tax=Engystomops pustulosus TaxID=76066 RepID=A0AAV6ZQ13_ENGPU|nr:hypothetical protein GDO81_003973 [Engystomops pustulosus]
MDLCLFLTISSIKHFIAGDTLVSFIAEFYIVELFLPWQKPTEKQPFATSFSCYFTAAHDLRRNPGGESSAIFNIWIQNLQH